MRYENNRLTDVVRASENPSEITRRPPARRGAQFVNIIAPAGQRFLLSKPVSASVHDTSARSAAERGVRLARRPRHRLISLARRPPATPTPHSAPTHRCNVHTTPRIPTSSPPLPSMTRPDRPPCIMHRSPHPRKVTQSQRTRCRKSRTFESLKRRGNRTRNCKTMAAPQIPRTMRRKRTQNLFSVFLIGLEERSGSRNSIYKARNINGVIELMRPCRALTDQHRPPVCT